ncbi:hypothetical protein VTN77DRAFT_4328 [Rasamsonia byssochlamydoides]|uniref:uncharacterized protein n=1 Tax=Rasamsonia byssochlamydoides TaxID=89139 RepID=UPI0037437882
MDRNSQSSSGDKAMEKSVNVEAPASPDSTDLKREDIRRACQERDVKALVDYATSKDGLLDDELRRLAWPILLGSDRTAEEGAEVSAWNDLPRHRDEDQVKLDVDRSFVYYPNCPAKELDDRKQELSDLITETLRRYPMLCYFQGYHDIAQVLLLVLGAQQARQAFARVSLFRIRDYMLPSLSPAVKHLQLIPAILESTDPKLRRHLAGTQPFFALAATLTLYAHDIQEYGDIARLYDFLLAHEPVVAIYLFAAIILSRKKELLEIPVNEPEMLHFTLSKLPKPLDLEGLIVAALELFRSHPPESLPFRAWQRIPRSSVLKTSRKLALESTTEEAKELFDLQTRELRREEFRKKTYAVMWRYRKPAGSVGLAILIALVSFYIRRKGLDAPIWNYVGRLKEVFHYARW